MEEESEISAAIESLSSKLKACLMVTKLSNRKIASHCLLTEATIRNVLKGPTNVELSTLTKLRLAFGMTLKALLDKETSFNKFKKLPVTISMYETTFASDKKNIGRRLTKLMKFRNLEPEELSILSDNTDYSKTMKYLKGAENITLVTLVKYGHGLELPFESILDFNGPMPTNLFVGLAKNRY